MLQKLFIQNYILIKELSIEPDSGMNVITGETGAGKSILLGAVGLLMGARADSKTLYNPEEKCVIEGQFSLRGDQIKELFIKNDLDYENPCIVRREISVAGKSRSFVNDTPVNLDVLDAIVGELMDIHSQHETILLKKQNYQIQQLDSFAQNSSIKKDYQFQYSQYKSSEKQYLQLVQTAKSSAQELDYVSFIYKELEDLNLQSGELEKLEYEQKTLENISEIKEKLALSHSLLSGEEFALAAGFQRLYSVFEQLSQFSAEYKAIKEKLASIKIDLKDLSKEIEILAEETEIDPGRLQIVQDRLNHIYKLQRKHNVTSFEEIETLKNEFGKKLSLIENTDFVLSEAEKEMLAYKNTTQKTGEELSISRKKVLDKFEKLALEKLSLLGMSNATFQIRLTETTSSADGLEKATFYFSANKGLAPKPISEVASGGEFSRLMLVIKYLLAGKTEMPTLIFDEIDSGVSGEVAHNMAELIVEMSNRHQVFTITHLPQMASKGNSHFFVYKDESETRTVSNIRKLTQDERIKEIAKMIGGKVPSESALQSAKELIG